VVGGVVDGELRLLSVGPRVARLGTAAGDPAALELNLPEPVESR
jgi:general secretion pathway protein C